MKCCLDPGHGGTDPGAVFGPLKEKTICLAISKETARLCAIAGHIPLQTRTMDITTSLEERTLMANAWGADCFVSIHCNADPDDDAPDKPEAKGSEVFIYPGSQSGRKLAIQVAAAVPRFFPGKTFRGIKEGNFYVLRKTKMPAVLIEVAFIDTTESTKLAQAATQRKIAQAIAWAIDQYAQEMEKLRV